MIGRHVTHYNETVLLALLVADEPLAAPIGPESAAVLSDFSISALNTGITL